MRAVHLSPALIACFALGESPKAQQQRFTWTAADGASLDGFGFRVAIGGNRGVVTAPDHDDLGNGSGAVYVFDTAIGQQLFELTASDGGDGDYFGCSLAVSDGLALVGAPNASNLADDDSLNDGSGAAYLFDLATGLEIRKFTATDVPPLDFWGTSIFFGTSVAISSDRAVVSAVGSDELGLQSGSVYVFDVGTGQQLYKLMSSDGTAYDYFGHSLAAFGDRVIVGVPGHDDLGSCSGSAYVFDLTSGQQMLELEAADGEDWDPVVHGHHFGWSVAIGAERAVVGAIYDDERGIDAGAAYVFDLVTGAQVFKWTASDATPDDVFGFSMALSDDRVVVGAPSDPTLNPDQSSAYVFDLGTGQELFKLQALNGRLDDYFAFSVGISGDLVLVGSTFGDELGMDSGAARLFSGVLGDQAHVRSPLQAPRSPPWAPRR